MRRLIASCIWLIGVTSLSAYITATWTSRDLDAAPPSKKPSGLERTKTTPINVPMIANGNVAGYVVAQFVYLADAKTLQDLSVPPDDFITDEAFRALYSADVDFNRLEKYDLQGLTRTLAERINQRFGREIIKEVLVVEFTYIPKQDISK